MSQRGSKTSSRTSGSDIALKISSSISCSNSIAVRFFNPPDYRSPNSCCCSNEYERTTCTVTKRRAS
ncbi:Protein CBG23960 [Caenorhabditis briggsae]|uniref:Protein CBG23960 n=1 Tax=Caenorhabditis briggsae TaxID=6238 RepID=H8WGZ3_CAEBR|nr:Protein CBG23960 [Caenorhabditis briggsae]CCG58691.1 Protein CBG23960 [Caenorhabditis briggsae]